MKENIKYTIISILLIIIIIAPLIYIAQYNHSSADDYSYGILTHKTWEETHSIIEVIKTAIEQVKETYNEWQGTYAAVFLMSIQPAVFGEALYPLTTIILMATFIMANIYIMRVILKDYLKCEQKIYSFVIAIIVIFSIQFVPYAVQSFYWYNGSIYYTFSYSIMLILLGIILKLLKMDDINNKDENSNNTNKYSKRKIRNLIIAILLSIFIGGTNYTTALVFNMIIATISLILIIKKDKRSIYVCAIFAICLISLTINMLAPGNANRQSTMQKMNAIDSIFLSIECAFIYIKKWTNLSTLWVYLIMIPIILNIIKQINYKFKMPILFTIITFGIFSAQFTPPLYAQGGAIPARLFNIIYFSMYWLIILNIGYWLGYLNNKINITVTKKDYKYLCVILIIFGIFALSKDYKKMNSYVAIKSIQSGEAYQYDMQMKQRIDLYNNKSIYDVEVKKLNVRPFLLFSSDITKDVADWQNRAVADFYNKKSVKIKD